ncbi:MAG: toxin [Desulfobacteraceae bacterium A6]|nr:BrnT family toxin [Pseudomonadota bacterium]OQW96666.1 MAG: toxin [Desulfobacteraceae bacterium A6]
MPFEWDPEKSIANKEKHGIDFDTAKIIWSDENRIEIHVSYPMEDRWIMIGKTDDKLWTAVFTLRGNLIRIISVRRSRKKEVDLYEEKVIRKE